MSLKGAQDNPEFEKILKDEFGIEDDAEGQPVAVPAKRHFELASLLKNAGYSIYVSVVATHYPAEKETKKSPAKAERFEVTTLLRKVGKPSRLAVWRVELETPPKLVSLVPLFAGADWQEREQYDLVGVEFEAHPDLRRLMMPEDWEGHPLRKDYAIDTPCLPWR